MGQLVEGGWTADHTEALRESVLSGLTYSQSAVEINKKYGTHYTRNSAIGRANRIGLQCPKKEGRPTQRAHQPYKPRRKRPKLVAPARPVRCEVLPGNVSLLELADNGCRYPTDDRSPFVFCNSPQRDGSSYCPEHMRLCERRSERTSEA
jgi:hypothetical protein